jgi:hypothetical protein
VENFSVYRILTDLQLMALRNGEADPEHALLWLQVGKAAVNVLREVVKGEKGGRA